MGETIVYRHSAALSQMLQGAWSEFWIVSPRLGKEAVAQILPQLRRTGAAVRVLTHLSIDRLASREVEIDAVRALLDLPTCEIRTAADLPATLYATGPEGAALVTGAALTAGEFDGGRTMGMLLAEGAAILQEVRRWWETALPLTPAAYDEMAQQSSKRLAARKIGEELARVGAFVRVSMYGSRRTRRLDPREFGVTESEWGRLVRPAEVILYRLDDVIRTRDELESLLKEVGLEWNGHYLVPRHFLEREWPRLFAARERQLRERLASPEGQMAIKAQLTQARSELEAFFGDLYARAQTQGMEAATWIDMQTTRVLAEVVSDTILAESGLEYRVLAIAPEDVHSSQELGKLLQDPRLRTVQLTFQF